MRMTPVQPLSNCWRTAASGVRFVAWVRPASRTESEPLAPTVNEVAVSATPPVFLFGPKPRASR